jgi:sulfate transport system permease protein
VAPLRRHGGGEPAWVRRLCVGLVLGWLGLVLVLPLALVFREAFAAGLRVWWQAVGGGIDPATLVGNDVAALARALDARAAARAAISLTLVSAGSAVVLNTVFGVAAAWLLTRYTFPGKTLITALIDLPFAISPVVAGLMIILVYGVHGWVAARPLATIERPVLILSAIVSVAALVAAARSRDGRRRWLVVATLAAAAGGAWLGWLRPWLAAGGDLPMVFATPGIVLATVFVTFPFVARELIPVMQSLGQEEEQAALSLGAGGWTILWRITLPNVKWGLLYGLTLANARAMGEFGAVSVVSGHIRGQTISLPLHIEILFNEFQFTAAFAMASLLAMLALLTLAAKSLLEWRLARIGLCRESP